MNRTNQFFARIPLTTHLLETNMEVGEGVGHISCHKECDVPMADLEPITSREEV